MAFKIKLNSKWGEIATSMKYIIGNGKDSLQLKNTVF